MTTCKLSLILPCYNVEKYIVECLESLYSQDISEEMFEIIAVNDCSTDGTRNIICYYQKKHKNINLIDHITNKSQGIARNTGFKNSIGKYIWFIDPDDYIDKNIFGLLLEEIESNNLDILSFEYEKLLNINNRIKNKIADTSGIIEGENFLNNIIGDWMKNGSVCCKIFNKNYLKYINLTFSQGNYLEDQIYSLRATYFSKRFKHISKSFYNYRHHSDSSMNSHLTAEKYISITQFISDLFQFSQEISLSNQQLHNSIINVATHHLFSVLKPLVFLKHIDRVKAVKLIRPYKNVVCNLRHDKNWRIFIIKYSSLSIAFLFFLSPILRYSKYIKRTLIKFINQYF